MKRIIVIIACIFLFLPIWIYADEPETPPIDPNDVSNTEHEETGNLEPNETVIINQYTGAQQVIITEDYTQEITTDSIPMPPLHLKYTNVTTDSVSIVWNENIGYDKVDSYNIYVNGGKVGNSKTSSYVIDDLLPGRKYKISITALNYYGESYESAPIEVITHRSPIATPKNVRAINITEKTALINWESNGLQDGLYNIYLNGKFFDSTSNTYYQVNNLQSNTDYSIGIEPDGDSTLLTVIGVRTGDVIGQETISTIINSGFEYIGTIWPYMAVILGIVLTFAIASMILGVFENFDVG